jgi:hypothetical protein
MKKTNKVTQQIDSTEAIWRKRDKLFHERDKAIERLVSAWIKRHEANYTEHSEEELNWAADALVMSHMAMTFQVVH